MLAAINFIVLAVFVFLVTIQFQAVLSGSIRERLAVVVENVRDPFSSVTAMGLPLSSLRNANAMLQRVKQDDEEIDGIEVYGAQGAILHSTEEVHDASIPQEILAAGRSRDGHNIWYLEDERYFRAGGAILDATGAPVGGVSILYSKSSAVTRVRAMAARLAFYCGLGLVLTLFVALPILRFAMRRHVGLFDALLEAFGNFERRFWRAPGGAEQEGPEVKALGVDTAEFSALLDRSEQRYAAEKQRFAAGRGGQNERD
jgi:hypothetical protein